MSSALLAHRAQLWTPRRTSAATGPLGVKYWDGTIPNQVIPLGQLAALGAGAGQSYLVNPDSLGGNATGPWPVTEFSFGTWYTDHWASASAYASEIVRISGGNGAWYSAGNEPEDAYSDNISPVGNATDNPPWSTGFAYQLRAVTQAILALDPGARFVGPNLTGWSTDGDPPGSNGGLPWGSPITWWNAVVAKYVALYGVKPPYTYLTVHNYTHGETGLGVFVGTSLNYMAMINNFSAAAVANGYPAAVWMTEGGVFFDQSVATALSGAQAAFITAWVNNQLTGPVQRLYYFDTSTPMGVNGWQDGASGLKGVLDPTNNWAVTDAGLAAKAGLTGGGGGGGGGGGASFPTTPVLDNFNRTENPLSSGGSWLTGQGTYNGTPLGTNGSQAVAEAGFSGSTWLSLMKAPVEVYVDLPGAPAANYSYLTWFDGTSGTPTGYFLLASYANSNGSWEIVRVSAGTQTTLASGNGVNWAAGDAMGMSVGIDGQITAWRRAGGIWGALGSVTDSLVITSGHIGLLTQSSTMVWDNFGGGGGAAAFPTTPVLDNFDRAAENPLSSGGKWVTSAGCYGGTPLGTDGSHAIAESSFSGSNWGTAMAPPLEVYADLPGTPTINYGYLTWFDGVSGSPSGYYVLASFSASPGYWAIVRVAAGAQTTLASGSYDWTTGDAMGMSISAAGVISFWHRISGVWVQLGAVTEASLVISSGYIGLLTQNPSMTFDNFGGGRSG